MGKERKRVSSNSRSGGSGLVKCPYCGFDGGVSAFKLLRDPWRFRFYEVRGLRVLNVMEVDKLSSLLPLGTFYSFRDL